MERRYRADPRHSHRALQLCSWHIQLAALGENDGTLHEIFQFAYLPGHEAVVRAVEEVLARLIGNGMNVYLVLVVCPYSGNDLNWARNVPRTGWQVQQDEEDQPVSRNFDWQAICSV
jgi:hypothetical protein